MTSGSRQVAVDSAGQRTVAVLVAGYIDVWRRLADAGVPVVAISDTPGTRAMRTPDCVAAHVEDPNGACAWSSSGGGGSAALRAAAAEVAEATYVDMNPWVCADGICRAVQRNVVTYRYGSHLTATFAGLLTGRLEEQLVPLVEQAATR
ncbi:MAG: hypothetical protein H0U62_12175 [Actinobacteria bacterium]|nr:hypothetical protein [Actinomycetota bacterium]